MTSRRSQHRPPRETEAKSAAELRQENRSLRRQLSKLRRENSRLQGVAEEQEQEAEEELAEAPTCPECKSIDLVEIKTPSGKTVTSCRSCKKWRSVSQDSL